jgi:predicted Rossmann fold nucleotide-binding protein DprA/Smf involved in DNA uptake
MEFCKKFIEDLTPLDPVIVSDFAYGVDIVAHQLAMDNSLQTIGVLAHGLNQIYPKTHKYLQNGRKWRIYNRVLEFIKPG